MTVSRRFVTQLLLLCPQLSNMAWAGVEGGQSASTVPSETWEEHSDIAASGFTPDGVASVMKMLRDLPTTSLMVVSYGYLWWIPQGRPSADWLRSFLAYGNYGQFILGLPQIDMVIVHRVAVTDEFAVARNLGTDLSSPKGVSAGEFFKIADAILSARQDTRHDVP